MRTVYFSLLLLLSVPCAAQQGTETVPPLTVTVGVNNAPPYRIIEPGRATGLYVDIFKEVARLLGWRVRFREAPFRRVLLMMEQGEVDIMLGPLKTPEREKKLAYIAPAFPPERRLFFYLNADNRISRYSDLYGKRIGVLEGASYFHRFDKDGDLLKEPAKRYENLMLMMQRGRVDVVIAPELVGRYTINKLGLDAHISPFFVPGERSWIAVAKNSPALRYADDIRAALKLMDMKGERESLLLKYLGQPLP
ncbi:extracellular solute-binding protein, family 3 [Marinobacter santoriniensis NKSG1]|uniref:Extracellular solute-binding protein, family 3 n=1 Tax=Marinobacter santoriniensis NKSG1 TaxID=1288826 RepID=M7CQG7_9GAMM|nr:transporter substrate-binding domain-containing protein [Marinobacter santoriniensis]EMP54320.1 extracellular solute-binding protein, family 3 [Marinobacter santoriniensis NKSG1]